MKLKHLVKKQTKTVCKVCEKEVNNNDIGVIMEHYEYDHPFEWSVAKNKYGPLPFYSRWRYIFKLWTNEHDFAWLTIRVYGIVGILSGLAIYYMLIR